jgi:hypothetical protein
MKRNVIRSLCMFAALVCPACNGSTPAPGTTPPPGQIDDSALDTVTDFIGQALDGWGQSQFLQAIGLQPAGVTQAQFEQLEGQMAQMNTEINQVLQDDQQILYDQAEMEAYMKQASLDALSDSFVNLENPQQTIYAAFVSAVQDGTGGPFFSLPDIIASASIMDEIANAIGCTEGAGGELTCTQPINLLINDTEQIIGSTAQGAGEIITVPNFASQLFGAIQTYALENFPRAGTLTSGYDLPTQITLNNETLMAYLSQMASLVQQDSNILSTLLYLKYYAPASAGWESISIPVPGFNDNNTYDQNMTALNTFFSDAANAMHASATSFLLSDNPGDPSSAGTYKNVKTLPGVSEGTWAAGCNLYVWSGASTAASGGFTDGVFDGQHLAALCTCNGETVTTLPLDLISRCYDASTDQPVMTQIGTSYLECQYLSQTNIVTAAPFDNSVAGYGSGYAPPDYVSQDFDAGYDAEVYGSTPVLTPGSNSFGLTWPDSHQSYVSQMVQVNFPNGERAMFNISAQASQLIEVQCGDGMGNANWGCMDNSGEEPEACAGGWKGGGYSQLTLMSPSTAMSVLVRVDGGGGIHQPYLHLEAQ